VVRKFKVGLLCRCKKDLWQNSRQIVRIAKRKKHWSYRESFTYFVVGDGHATGYGTWVDEKDLIPLTPLELLALQAED